MATEEYLVPYAISVWGTQCGTRVSAANRHTHMHMYVAYIYIHMYALQANQIQFSAIIVRSYINK